MIIQQEDQVLDDKFRLTVLKEICGTNNIARKAESKRRYDIYKDKIKKYVIKALKSEGLLDETVAQMSNRCANISIARKIVNKLARTYSAGVTRTVPGADENAEDNQAATKQVDDYAELMRFNERMRKGDRYRELQKNMFFQIVPEQVGDEEKYKIAMRTLLPWHYDVLEDARDREVARCVILSDYSDECEETSYSVIDGGSQGYHNPSNDMASEIAVAKKKQIFVWWTDNYHFSTDEKGAFIPNTDNADNVNPIAKLPFVNNADEQDGYFWAEGGDDLIDGTVLINKIITDMFFIAYQQGWGQTVITGRNLKDDFAVGVNNALVLTYDPESGDPKPEVSVVSAQPPLSDWLKTIEQYIALLLTTNNLSTANVAMQLNSATQAPSGIAMLIERSEAIDDISDKQNDYQDQERQIWKIIALWHNEYLKSKQLIDEYAAIGAMPEDLDVNLKFNEPKPVISETEKLQALKLRKDLGISEEVDLLMIDNPALSREDAEKKLLAINKEKLSNMTQFQLPLKTGVAPNGQIPQNADNSGSQPIPGKQQAMAKGGAVNDAKNGNKASGANA